MDSNLPQSYQTPLSDSKEFDKTQSKGHIRVPRSLTQDPLFRDLPCEYKIVIYTILENVCYRPQRFNDHGIIIELQPGQLCMPYRELAERCGKDITKNHVERGVKRAAKCGFVRQEVRHKKSIITVTHPETYDLILRASETTNETILRQERDKNETQKKKERRKEGKKEEAAAVFFDRSQGEFVNVTDDFLKLIQETFLGINITAEMRKMREWLMRPDNQKRDGNRAFISGWLKKCKPEKEIIEEECQPPQELLDILKTRDKLCKTRS